MNKLPTETRVQILSMLCEGSSMRATSRITGVSLTTILKLLVDAGLVCARYHDEYVRGLKSERIQCDEIWAFCYAKDKNLGLATAAPEGAGDAWTWTAIDADSKMIVSYLTGPRDAESAVVLMEDLRDRLTNRVQLTTDGLKAYLVGVEQAFGNEIDYGMLVKMYGNAYDGPSRYSPPVCTGARKTEIIGNPEPKKISTSYVERSNLSMRMHMRRFTRLTNAHSKKFENHCHAQALYFMFYNFVRINKAVKMSPAMAAGIETRLWEMSDIVALIDAAEAKPNRPKTYQKQTI